MDLRLFLFPCDDMHGMKKEIPMIVATVLPMITSVKTIRNSNLLGRNMKSLKF